MKALAFLGAAFLAACAAAPPPALLLAQPMDGQRDVERLFVDGPYRPPIVHDGGCFSCFYELPKGAYIAQGWPYYYNCCFEYPSCGHGTWYLKRALCRTCCCSPCRCASIRLCR